MWLASESNGDEGEITGRHLVYVPDLEAWLAILARIVG
jgi:hypothetical protein